MRLLFIFFFLWLQFSIFGQNSVCSDFRNPGTDSLPGCLLCRTTISGVTDNFTATTIPRVISCGPAKRNSFFSVRSNSLGQIHFNAFISGCNDGMKAILLNSNLEEVSDCFTLKVNNPFNSVSVENLVPSTFYTLMLDIVSTDCKYNIAWRTDDNYGNDLIGDADSIQLPTVDLLSVCVGKELEFSIPPVAHADFYDWVFPEFLNPVSQFQNNIKLKVVNGQRTGTLEVTPYSGCKSGKSSPSTSIQSARVLSENIRFPACSGQLPFDFDGVTFTNLNIKSKTVTKADGCDSLVTYQPFFFEDTTRMVDTAMCVGEIFEMDGHQFSDPGFFDFIGSPSTPYLCDTIIRMALKRSGDIAPAIECVNDTFLNLLSFKWDEIELATNYEISINGAIPIKQANIGFLYQPNFSGEEIDIKIQPVNVRGCSFEPGFATCIAPDLTALSEKDLSKQIQIFPNPSTGIFQISSFLKIEKTEVFDFSGRQVLTGEGEEIDLTDEWEGVYIFKIFTEDGVGVRRVFKK